MRLGIALEVTADLDAVELRHHDVEDQEGRPERAQLDQRLVPVAGRLDLESPRMMRQELDEHLDDLRLVVDHEHARRRRWNRIGRHPMLLEEALELSDVDARMPAGRLEGAKASFPDPRLQGGRRDLAM